MNTNKPTIPTRNNMESSGYRLLQEYISLANNCIAMFDPAEIQLTYARMTDRELIRFNRFEKHGLTDAARQLFEEELARRGLQEQETDEQGLTEDSLSDEDKPAPGEDLPLTTEQWEEVVSYAADEKLAGKTNDEIFEGLLGTGISTQQANNVLAELQPLIQRLHDKYDRDVLYGIIAFLVGAVLTFVTYTNASNGGIYIIAWGAIAFGPIRAWRGAEQRTKYRAILDNMSAEQGTVPAGTPLSGQPDE